MKLNLLNFWKYHRALLGVQDPTDPEGAVPVSRAAPLPVEVIGDGSASAAQEATLQQVRDAVLALGGNTDGLETLLTNLGAYSDQVESMLGTLSTNTDGIEGLLSALGVSDGNVLAKLEALRLLLAGTLTTTRAAPGTTTYDVGIAAGQSVGTAALLAGRTPLRLIVGASWTAADLTVQTSLDGVTWADLYDSYGTALTIKAGASRAIVLPVADLVGINHIRLRSGTPGAPVVQAALANLTLVAQVL